MTEAESQRQFFEMLAIILEWMPWVSTALLVTVFIFCASYVWYRERLHKKGIMHRNYDGWDDGYSWLDQWKGRKPNDQHLWDKDAERANQHTVDS